MKNLISLERKNRYKKMFKEVSNTPLLKVEWNNNTYFFKCEYQNNYGNCHYARVFAYLLYLKEMLGIIKPGDVLLETTSGSGGRAAAAVATALGYTIHIGLPAGGEKAREESIVKAGGILHLTPAEDYISGFPKFVSEFLETNKGVKYINHCMSNILGRGSDINHGAIQAIAGIVEEGIEQLHDYGFTHYDYVVHPMGNGTTTLAFCEWFKEICSETKVIGIESFASGFTFRKKFPGLYEETYGIEPTDFPRHNLPGTTPTTASFAMPAIDASVEHLDEIVMVADAKLADTYKQITSNELPSEIIRWDNIQDMHSPEMHVFGRSAQAAIAVAQNIAQRVTGKTFFIPVMDAAWHYDS
jgi:cysteine synthase